MTGFTLAVLSGESGHAHLNRKGAKTRSFPWNITDAAVYLFVIPAQAGTSGASLILKHNGHNALDEGGDSLVIRSLLAQG